MSERKKIYGDTDYAVVHQERTCLVELGIKRLYVCQRCGLPTSPSRSLIVYKEPWDRVCGALRRERYVPEVFNQNILLCPECMEGLNGGPFVRSEVPGLLVNHWYIEKIPKEDP